MRNVLVVVAGEGINGDDAARIQRALLDVLVREADGEPCLHVYGADIKLATGIDVELTQRAIVKALKR